MYYCGNSVKPFSTESLIAEVTVLSTKESEKQRLLPLEALEYLTQAKDGEQRVCQSYRGKAHRRGDSAARELTIDCYHFQFIDLGDSIPL